MACPDSGADDNVIALEVANTLGLTIITEQEDKKQFRLGNGKMVQSLGKVLASCNLALGDASTHRDLPVLFYVFKTLAAPLIMGMAFLQVTETLSRYRDRLIEQEVPQTSFLRLYSIDTPRRHLPCRLNDDLVLANADSGSDLDLVSAEYAESHAWQIDPREEVIEFADGSRDTTSGLVRITFAVENLK